LPYGLFQLPYNPPLTLEKCALSHTTMLLDSTQFFSAPHVTILLFCTLFLNAGLRLWLSQRQIIHVTEHRNAVPSAFAGQISLEAHQKAADYTLAKQRFGRFSLCIDIALLLLLTLGGGLQGLHDFWSGKFGGIPYGLAMMGSVGLMSTIAGLPLSYLHQFGLEAQFGFNRMKPTLFFVDLGKQLLLSVVLGGPVIAIVLWLIGATDKNWWLFVWLFWVSFNLLVLFIYPRWIAPLFNKFSPLEDAELKCRIEALLKRCEFTSGGLFVMDGSKRSSHGNAYFTGFGKNRRIVFFDTLLERLTPPQIEAVLAHELGHFKHRHVLGRIAMIFGLSLVFLWLLGQLITSPVFFIGLGLEQGNNALGLLLFSLVLPVFTFPLTPFGSWLSRRQEYEADAYAVSQTSGKDLSEALVKLYEDNAATLTPDPLHSAFYDSHPPAALRIAHLGDLATKAI
jgi:STE24 endopeptidase